VNKGRRASRHSKSIPPIRIPVIANLLNNKIEKLRRKKDYLEMRQQ